MDMAYAIVNTRLLVPSYGAITNIPMTGTGLAHTLEILTHIECYIYEVITVVQGGPKQQHQVFDGTVQTLKWSFLSLPYKTKYLGSIKNILTGEGE